MERSIIDGSTIECRNPATLERLGDVPALTPAQVRERVQRARRGQAAWAASSFAERRRVLRCVLDHVVAHQAELIRLIARDSGKTPHDASTSEVLPVCEHLRYLLAHGERDLSTSHGPSGLWSAKAVRKERVPLGVIGVMGSSSAPFFDLVAPALTAVFAGNAVVAKVSEWASWSAGDFQALFDGVFSSAGISTELVQIVTGGAETAAALAGAGVDQIIFTGTSQDAREVLAAAAPSLTPVVLQLGGKDAIIVCDDADLDQAVEATMQGVFNSSGQLRSAAQRIYVMDAIHDDYVARIVDQVRRLRQGPPDLGETEVRYDVGAITSPRRIEIFERQIEDALRKGARALVGGKRNPVWKGRFWEPTVLVGCDHTMAIAREETFGPIVSIVRVGGEEEAVRLVNDCDLGLSASLFTKDGRRAERMARAISAKTVRVNDHGLPMDGQDVLMACTAQKTVVRDRVPLHVWPRAYPMTRAAHLALEGAIGAIYGRGTTRLRGVARLLRATVERYRS